MPKLKDLTGLVFERLTVIQRQDCNDKYGRPLWECRCDCGTITTVKGYLLTSGQTKSCGCLQKEIAKQSMAANRTSECGVKAPIVVSCRWCGVSFHTVRNVRYCCDECWAESRTKKRREQRNRRVKDTIKKDILHIDRGEEQ